MARYSGKKQISEETRSEAMVLAKGTQSPGQTKAQTKLIAQGIERGIDLYKKERKEVARALERRQRDKHQQQEDGHKRDTDTVDDTPAGSVAAAASARQWLPWLLLTLTWTGMAVYLILKAA